MSYDSDENHRTQSATEEMIRMRSFVQIQHFRPKTAQTVETIKSRCVHELDPGEGCKTCRLPPLRTVNQMTPKQYVDAIDRLGLSQRAAGAFLGVDERQSRRWVAGDSAIPESVAKLLRLMIRLKLSPDEVA